MKILGVAYNYHNHQEESKEILGISEKNLSAEPIIFHKGDSILRPGRPFFLPEWSEQIDYEAEIVVMIDRVGKCISERFAHRYYSELSIGLDMTARDLQRRAISEGKPWTASKAFDNSAIIGRWMKKEELGYPAQPLEMRLERNGEVVQRALSSEMLHSIDKLIAYISEQHTLKMGDIIFTGTPVGVGSCHIGDLFAGYLGEHKLLEVEIK